MSFGSQNYQSSDGYQTVRPLAVPEQGDTSQHYQTGSDCPKLVAVNIQTQGDASKYYRPGGGYRRVEPLDVLRQGDTSDMWFNGSLTGPTKGPNLVPVAAPLSPRARAATDTARYYHASGDYKKLEPMNLLQQGDAPGLWLNGSLIGPATAPNCLPVEAPTPSRTRAVTASEAQSSQRLIHKKSKFSLPNIFNSLRTRSDSAPNIREHSSFLKRFTSKDMLRPDRGTAPTSTSPTNIPQSTAFTAYAPRVQPVDYRIIKESMNIQISAEKAFDDFEYRLAAWHYDSMPQTPQVKFNLGQLHLLMNDRVQARDSIRDALELDDCFTVGWFQLAYIEFIQFRYRPAFDAYIKCLRCMRSGRDVVYMYLGLNFTVTLEEVTWGLEAAQAAVNGGVYEPGLRLPCVPARGIFRLDERVSKAIMRGEGGGGNWNGTGALEYQPVME